MCAHWAQLNFCAARLQKALSELKWRAARLSLPSSRLARTEECAPDLPCSPLVSSREASELNSLANSVAFCSQVSSFSFVLTSRLCSARSVAAIASRATRSERTKALTLAQTFNTRAPLSFDSPLARASRSPRPPGSVQPGRQLDPDRWAKQEMIWSIGREFCSFFFLASRASACLSAVIHGLHPNGAMKLNLPSNDLTPLHSTKLDCERPARRPQAGRPPRMRPPFGAKWRPVEFESLSRRSRARWAHAGAVLRCGRANCELTR